MIQPVSSLLLPSHDILPPLPNDLTGRLFRFNSVEGPDTSNEALLGQHVLPLLQAAFNVCASWFAQLVCVCVCTHVHMRACVCTESLSAIVPVFTLKKIYKSKPHMKMCPELAHFFTSCSHQLKGVCSVDCLAPSVLSLVCMPCSFRTQDTNSIPHANTRTHTCTYLLTHTCRAQMVLCALMARLGVGRRILCLVDPLSECS
jgi:hypothetical protein